MANLPESATWETGIYQLEETDPVQGGPNGIDNLQGKQLANRTAFLKALAESLGTGKLDLSALATQAEATAGTDNTKWMTPLRVSQAIATLTAAANVAVQGASKNLRSSANGISANISITADEIVLEDASNNYVTARNVNVTINTAASGANGLDTGILAANTWYYRWIIRKPDGTTAGLLSLSSSAPTLPGGYTFKAYVGAVRTDGTANKYPLHFTQVDRRVNYVVSATGNLNALPSMASGAAGNISTPTYAAVGVSAFVPPTAVEIVIGLFVNQVGVAAMVAPNNEYGAYTSTTNAPPVMSAPSNIAGISISISNMVLESNNIYWASSAGTSNLFCNGWVENF